MVAVGGTVDMAVYTNVRKNLQDAADAAALASVGKAAVAANTSGGVVNLSALETLGSKTFQADTNNFSAATNPSVTVAVVKDATGIGSTVTYSAAYAPIFTGFLVGSIPVRGTSSAATGSTLGLANYYIAMDVSQSMGIAATTAGMSALSAKTGGCEFGCHVNEKGGASNNDIAEANKITLRVDMMRTAVAAVLDKIISSSPNPASSPVKVGLYGIHTTLSTLAAPSSDITTLRRSVGQTKAFYNYGLSTQIVTSDNSIVDLADMQLNNKGKPVHAQTSFRVAMPLFNNQVPAAATGPDARENIMFIITDGVANETGYGKDPFDASLCTPLKAKGRVAVLYATYEDIDDNGFIKDVKPLLPTVVANLKACASDGLYFQLADFTNLTEAMDAMFSAVVTDSVRLTN